MPKADTEKCGRAAYVAVIIVLGLLIIGTAYLYVQKSSAYTQKANAYSSLNSSYANQKSQSQSQIATLQNRLESNSTLLANLTNKYNILEYNLTNPYTKMLYNDYALSIPGETPTSYYNTTYDEEYDQYKPGQYNFSFNAPYVGYLIFNETNTGTNNNFTSSYFSAYFSTGSPYPYTDISGQTLLGVNTYIAPVTTLGPQSGKTYVIPVQKGNNYVLFENLNSQGITLTFNMKYVGFYTEVNQIVATVTPVSNITMQTTSFNTVFVGHNMTSGPWTVALFDFPYNTYPSGPVNISDAPVTIRVYYNGGLTNTTTLTPPTVKSFNVSGNKLYVDVNSTFAGLYAYQKWAKMKIWIG